MKKTVENLSEQNRQLMVENYVNSLKDEKTFRLELLQSLAKINVSLESIEKTISDGLSQELEENPEEEQEDTQDDSEEETED